MDGRRFYFAIEDRQSDVFVAEVIAASTGQARRTAALGDHAPIGRAKADP